MNTWDKSFWLVFILFLVLIGLVLFLPYAITQWNWVDFSFSDNSRLIGNTLGGILGPFVAIVASGLTFIAFWVQYKANQQQREDIRLERFENKFYEMLKLHKENVSEIDIDGKLFGRKAFIKMYEEFRFLYTVVKAVRLKEKKRIDTKLEGLSEYDEPEKLAGLVYSIFFFGIGQLDKRNALFGKEFKNPFAILCLKTLKEIKEYPVESPFEGLLFRYSFNKKHFYFNGNASSFSGHVATLAHYFRHLYQTMKFIVSTDILLEDEKYDYVKMLRAQLSNHEQTMIYYNSFFSAGVVWWQDEDTEIENNEGLTISYFLDYKLIKNIPFNLTTGMNPDPYKYFKHRLRKRYVDANKKFCPRRLVEHAKSAFEWKED